VPLADAGNLPLEQSLRRGDACLHLAAGIERIDARAAELEGLALSRLPVGHPLVELGIDLDRLLEFALKV